MGNNHSVIPSSVFKADFKGFIFLFIFIFLLIYGLGSIIYFTNLIILTGASNKSEFGVVVQNVLYTFSTALCVWIFIKWLDIKIKTHCWKYAVLFLLIEIFTFFSSTTMYFLVWKNSTGFSRKGINFDLGLQTALVPGIVGVFYFYFWKNSQKIKQKIDEQEHKLLQLEQSQTKAELAALEARINPHFLYNALNSISSLVHEKPDLAEEMTLKLSALFRKTTTRDESVFYTLAEEMDIVNTYLEIEQIRFGSKLHFETEVQEACLKAKVPKFIIQPLVENAIKHGTSKIIELGKITVLVKKNGQKLHIEVIDNGPKFTLGEQNGYGLSSIQEKLKLLFSDQATLTLVNDPIKAVIIEIPYEKV